MTSRNYKNIRVPYEVQEHLTLSNWLDWNRICYLHIPNEGKRDARQGKLLKRLGLKKGAPDFLIFDSPTIHPVTGLLFQEKPNGVSIELKRIKGSKTTAEQREWRKKLEDRGWIAMIIKGADSAIKALKELGYGRTLK